jgi:hypothetical protein
MGTRPLQPLLRIVNPGLPSRRAAWAVLKISSHGLHTGKDEIRRN